MLNCLAACCWPAALMAGLTAAREEEIIGRISSTLATWPILRGIRVRLWGNSQGKRLSACCSCKKISRFTTLHLQVEFWTWSPILPCTNMASSSSLYRTFLKSVCVPHAFLAAMLKYEALSTRRQRQLGVPPCRSRSSNWQTLYLSKMLPIWKLS